MWNLNLRVMIKQKASLINMNSFKEKKIKRKSHTKKQKALAVLLTALMLMSLLPQTALAADFTVNDGAIFDIGASCVDGDNITVSAGATATITGSKNVTISCEAGVTLTLKDVTSDVSGTSGACALSFTGSGNTLILIGDNTLKSGRSEPGVHVESGTALEIKGQDDDDSLTVSGGRSGAGIGGGNCRAGGTITIEGGTVTATGGWYGAGIGGGNCCDGGTITIEGGTVTATGGYLHGAGIGGGDDGNGGTITIKGGTVTATGGNRGAGIGGGNHGSGGTITIEGGTVTATCGYASGAGIGGGYVGDGGTITIEGGTVTATSGEFGAGIGGGGTGDGTGGGSSGTITISGGTVYAAKRTNENQDIGSYSQLGTFTLFGDALVFLRHDSCPTPVTVTHTHFSTVVPLYGFSLPSGWSDAGLYAEAYVITYNGNGGTGGTSVPVPKDRTAEIESGSSLSKPGYTFKEWNTEANGNGTSYTPGSSITMTGDVTLYAIWEDITYTVTYDVNGGEGAPASQQKTYGVTLALTSSEPTRTGYTFTGWATTSEGTAVYAPGDDYTANADITLFAVWTVNTYTVTYDANNGSGTAPIEGDKAEGATFTTAGNTFTAPDGKQFKEWNTAANGTGTSYAAGAEITMPGAALTLYAIWEDITYTVTYDANGGEGAPASQQKTYGVTLALTSSEPTRTGYTFTGWATTSEGTAVYAPGDDYTANADITLFAVWTINTYTVTYDANNGSGTAPIEGDKAEGATFTTAGNTFTAPDGKQFKEWNTAANGTGTSYAAGAEITMPGAALTLYAIWEDITYTVTYDANGGEGAPASQQKTYGVTLALTSSEPTRTGYTFTGWATTSEGTAVYAPGDDYTANADITLFAVWTINTYTVTYDANNGSGTAPIEGDKAEGATFTTAGNTFTAPDGKQFKEWNTAANGTGTSYAAGAEITMPGAALTLYAIWEDMTHNGNVVSGGNKSDKGKSIKITDSDGNTATGTLMETDNGVSAEISRDDFDELADISNNYVTLDMEIATVTFSSDAVDTISGASDTGDISMTVEEADTSTLSYEAQELIGSRTVYDITLMAGDTQISEMGGTATITVSYEIVDDEDSNAIVVYYIDNDGNLTPVHGRYNEENGTVEFTVTHFSKYAVGYNKVSFDDVLDTSWYYDAVTFCAAREITAGTGKDTFNPDSTLTRGQFIVMLMRAYGIEETEDASDNFDDAGDTYYTGYLAAARNLGITSGVGDNLFLPEAEITRQDMFTLLYRALDVLGELPETVGISTLSDFSDTDEIYDYAEEAMETFFKAGVVSGDDGKLDPLGSSTRAQLAQVLYNLLTD